MSDNSDIEEIKTTPTSAECLRRCKEFAQITGTDSALAMFYLQDLDWDLNVYILIRL
jgi:tyrosyl-DNA phosphodiesterase 2